MFFDERCRMRPGLGIQHIGDVALLPKLDVLAFVLCGQLIAHAGKEIAQFLRIGVRKFDKLEAIGAGWIFDRDLLISVRRAERGP